MESELTLPSGRRARLRVSGTDEGTPGALRLLEGLEIDGKKASPHDLPLADFHVLRALLMHGGALHEKEIAITCKNCAAEIRVRPCAALEVSPWLDGELGDPELDATLPFGAPIDIAPIAIGRVRLARSVVFAPRTVREALPLLLAASFSADEPTVRAMGLVALGDVSDPERIAQALAHADTLDDVAAAYLDSHYPARLGAPVFCAKCGARNDVDAPYERELARGEARPPASGDLPPFPAFADRAREIFVAMEVPDVELVVLDGIPAVDDGGEPLLGSYLPPHVGDASSPSRPATVTVYYRTFRAIEVDDGPYDWREELCKTIEHELEHHRYYLRGEDPMDDEERAEIDREAVRVVGKREASRRVMRAFGESVGDFVRRTWLVWLLVCAATAWTLCSSR